MASGPLAPELLETEGLERDPRGYLVKPGSPGADFAEPSLERSISAFRLQPGLTSSIQAPFMSQARSRTGSLRIRK